MEAKVEVRYSHLSFPNLYPDAGLSLEPEPAHSTGSPVSFHGPPVFALPILGPQPGISVGSGDLTLMVRLA